MTPMIAPVKSRSDLLDEIRATCPVDGSVAVWWLGQSGYVIKGRSATLVVDPYLSEHLTQKYEGTNKPHIRMTEAPFRGEDFDQATLILSTHKHSDHMDPGTLPSLMKASRSADLLYPIALGDHLATLGLEPSRCVGVDDGDLHLRAGVSIRPVPSAHEALDKDDLGRHLFLGYVIELDGVRLYHSGDTLAYQGLVEALGNEPFDVLFLPINGRDPARGVAGNMTADEAVALTNQVKPRFVVPHHYDMFRFNTVPVQHFEQAAAQLAPGIAHKVLRCGERWEVGPWASA